MLNDFVAKQYSCRVLWETLFVSCLFSSLGWSSVRELTWKTERVCIQETLCRMKKKKRLKIWTFCENSNKRRMWYFLYDTKFTDEHWCYGCWCRLSMSMWGDLYFRMHTGRSFPSLFPYFYFVAFLHVHFLLLLFFCGRYILHSTSCLFSSSSMSSLENLFLFVKKITFEQLKRYAYINCNVRIKLSQWHGIFILSIYLFIVEQKKKKRKNPLIFM